MKRAAMNGRPPALAHQTNYMTNKTSTIPRIAKKILFPRVVWLIDALISLVGLPGMIALKMFRRIGAHRLPLTRKVLEAIGIFPIVKSYSEPLFTVDHTETSRNERYLPGLNLGRELQLGFLEKLVFSEDVVRTMTDNPDQKDKYCIKNGTFEAGDAEFLFQFIRWLKPKRIVEIGCGNSTHIMQVAIDHNYSIGQARTQHFCIEPYGSERISHLQYITVISEQLEKVQGKVWENLEAGDFLFIDSSHMISPAGDVLKEFLELIPALPGGVYIHVHDIFTPRDYPPNWYQQVCFLNEQYILEALLSSSPRYEVIGALNYLKHAEFDKLKRVCPFLTNDSEPGSFYFRTVT